MGKNVPKLRFKGFEGEWEEKRLGDISDITKLAGFEFTKYVQYSDYGEKIALRGLNVKNGKLDLEDIKFIDNSDFSKLNRSKLYKNDLLFTYVGTIGELAIIDEDNKYYLAPNVCRIRLNSENVYFVRSIISTDKFYKKIILPKITMSSQPALTMENIRLFKILLPSLQEQEKIANLLSKVDRYIELQEKKVSELEKYKKGMMQKIFSQKIRFRKDDGGEYPEWEEKTLGQVADIVGGGTPSTSEQDYWDGNIQWFTPAEIKSTKYVSKSLRTITELGVKKSSAKVLPKGTILLTTRATLGEMAIAENEVTTNQGFQSLIVKSNCNNEYIYYLQDQIKAYCYKKSSGSTFLEISKSNLEKFKLKLPCLQEQEKIVDFISKVDLLIEKQNKRLDELKMWKKGLLQKMFV